MCTCIVGSAQCSGCVVYGPGAMTAISVLLLLLLNHATLIIKPSFQPIVAILPRPFFCYPVVNSLISSLSFSCDLFRPTAGSMRQKEST